MVSQGADANAARALATGRYPEAEPMIVSIGVVCMREGDTLDSLISRADEALYAAKRAGRNAIWQS
ncbi:GGDEF domain-containing protein [Solidesulfovibrio sp. C21]|uniref:GGDEF domain-containing protein n=1 Tax=Solidesulfovibrio sp. C21 TaxID=3398613 RepID=UPI0039FD4982